MDPLTRRETYYAAMAGESSDIPEPVTREEQYLKKIAESGGGGGSLPEGGTAGQVLTKKSDTAGDAEWKDPEKEIPSGGTTGQVLKKKSDEDYDAEWGDAGGGGGGGEYVEYTVPSLMQRYTGLQNLLNLIDPSKVTSKSYLEIINNYGYLAARYKLNSYYISSDRLTLAELVSAQMGGSYGTDETNHTFRTGSAGIDCINISYDSVNRKHIILCGFYSITLANGGTTSTAFTNSSQWNFAANYKLRFYYN